MAVKAFKKDGQEVSSFSVTLPPLSGEETEFFVTDPLSNSNDQNTADIVVRFAEAVPDTVVNGVALTTRVRVVVEKQFLGGEWVAIGESDEHVLENGDDRQWGVYIKIQSRNPSDIGQRFALANGYLYQFNSHPGQQFRLRFVARDYGNGVDGALQSVKITAGVDLRNE